MSAKNKAILITGTAGFVGAKLAADFADKGFDVLGIDAYRPYYSIELKNLRTHDFCTHERINILRLDLSDINAVKAVFSENRFDSVIHLAAQPGVRIGPSKFDIYARDNLVSFSNILQSSIEAEVQNFLYASSSSVYGNEATFPLSEKEIHLKPVSYYGATKVSNELMARSAASYSNMKIRGLRFFTVYGPYGRPDMAYYKLINSALRGEEFNLFGDGTKVRDFTFIDDITNTIQQLESQLEEVAIGFNDVVNIAGGEPQSMTQLISAIQNITSKKININMTEDDSKDVEKTIADRSYLESLIGNLNFTSFINGIERTVEWHQKLARDLI